MRLFLFFTTIVFVWGTVFSSAFCSELPFASPRAFSTKTANLTIHPDRTVRPLEATLFGVNVSVGDKPRIADPDFIERVKQQGYTSFRFPNGCQADLYNWKSPNPNHVTVDEFMDFCDAVDGEAYYTLNLQGGTDGLEGPPPEGAGLDEIIRYRHLAPNPCGYTNYHYGTLAEALELFRRYTVDRALEGKRPLLHYEMGNENWGQAFTDWPPDVYGRTIEVYSKALRNELEQAKRQHPELRDLELYIVAVGFPVMGNNMKFADTPDRITNELWTAELNRLYRDGVIDAVQEHFYPYSNANGGALVWVAHNLNNILYTRNAWPNPRLGGYIDPDIAYEMPIEITEWNIKCWGPQFHRMDTPSNGGFEDGFAHWEISGTTPSLNSWSARRGNRGVRVNLKQSDEPVEISQRFDIPEGARILIAGAWARTTDPQAVSLILRDPETGNNFAGYQSQLTNTWERIIASGSVPDGLTSAELVITITGPASAYIDEVSLYYTDVDSGHGSMSAVTYEQVLFTVDALMSMAQAGVVRSHLHHLMGNYPCGAMNFAGEIKDLGRAFEFFSERYGDRIVEMDLETPDYRYASGGHPWATDFNALAPNQDDIPMLSAMASRDDKDLHVVLLNRSSDTSVNVEMDITQDPARSPARITTLHGPDIDLSGAVLTQKERTAGRTMWISVEPYSAQVITIRLQ